MYDRLCFTNYFVIFAMHARFRFFFKTLLYQMKYIIMLTSHWCSCRNGTVPGADVQYHGSSCLCSIILILSRFELMMTHLFKCSCPHTKNRPQHPKLMKSTLYTELGDHIVTNQAAEICYMIYITFHDFMYAKKVGYIWQINSNKKNLNNWKKNNSYIKLHTKCKTKFH